ncbi:MAG: hypothetical protein GY849_01390, partial [Deltaproteobacteria bacterium]|nr:hypothetical protein [Deltaproteobacteria bacterium]
MFRLLSIALLSASLLLIPPAEARTSGQKDTPTLVIAGPGINSDGGVLFYHVQQMFSMGAKGFKPTTVQFHGNAAHVKGRAPIPAKRGDKRAIKGAAIRAGKMASENPHAMLRLDMDLMGVGIALGKGVAGAPFRLVGKTRLAREAGATIDAIRTRWDLETERASAFIEEAAREFKKKHGDKAKVIVVGHSAFTNAINLTPLDDPRTGKPLIDFRVMSSPMIRKVKHQDPDRTMFVTHENDLPPANMGSFISPLSMTEQDLTWAGTVLHLKGKTLNPFSAHSETQYYNTVYDMEIRTPGAKQTFRGRTPAEVIMRYKDAVFRGERRPQKTLLNSLKKQTPKESRVGGITLTKPADLPLNPSEIVNIDIGRLSDWPLFNFGAQGIIRLPDNLDKDAAAAAMKCVYLDRPPELSLMPGRSRKGEPLTMVQYLSKHLGLTKLGDLMLEADRILAAVAWGGSASYRPPEGIPGYHPFSEIALDHETFWNGSLGARVWVVPASIRFSAKHGRFSVEDATMAVRFEFYPMDKERVYYEKNADVGFSDPAGDFLAAQLTGHFDALAAQYPALEKLKRAAEFVGILIWAKENKIPLSSDARQWIKSNYRTDRDTNLYTGKPRRLEQIGNYLFEVLPFVDVRKADPAAVARPAII